MNQGYRKRIYERYASIIHSSSLHYDNHSMRRWGQPYHHYLKGWLPSNPTAKILEIGCGGGRMLFFLKNIGYLNIEGVDISSEQVDLSRNILTSESIYESDAIPFLESRSNSFDLILGLDIIEHLQKDECFQFLDAAFQALKPGGRLVLQTPNAASPWGSEYRYGDFTHELGFTPDSLKGVLSVVGFQGIEIREMRPVLINLKSAIRLFLWRLIRLFLMAWNYIEIGNPGSRVYTRNMLISGKTPFHNQ